MIDAFKVGVSIAMTTNTAQVLGVMLRDLGQVQGAVGALNRNLEGTKVLAAAAMTALAGAAVIKGMWEIVSASRALNDELSRMKMMGGEFAAGIGRTRDAAVAGTMATPTMNAAQAVQMQREVAGLLGDPQLAADLLPTVSKAAYVASFYTKERPETIVQNLLKMADTRGALTTERDGKKVINFEALLPELDAAIKAMVIQGGMLSSRDLLGMIKQGSVPFRSMSAEAAYLDMAEIASVMGGQRTGTALTSMYQQFIGGKMTKQTAESLTAAGMLQPGDWTSGRSGGVVVTPEGTRRFSAMERSPADYFATEGQAKIKAYATEQGISETAAMFRLLGRQTTQRLVAEILNSEPQIARTRQIASGMPGFEDQYAGLMRENLTTNVQSFSAAWTTLMQVIGEAGVPAAIGLLQAMTGAIQGMTRWAAENPETVATLLEVGAGIGALALAVGLFAIGSAAAGALAMLAGPVGLAAVAGGLAAIAASLALFPPWLVAMIGGGAAGGVAGFAVGGPVGAGVGAVLGAGGGAAATLPMMPQYSVPRELGPVQDDQRTPFARWFRRQFGGGSVAPPPGAAGAAGGAVPVILMNPDDLEIGVAGALTRRFTMPSIGGGVDERMRLPIVAGGGVR